MLGATDSGMLGPAREIDVLGLRLRELRALGPQDLDGAPRLERERLETAGLRPPQRDELLELLRVLLCEVRALARIGLGIEELPLSAGGSRPTIRGPPARR